jgi:predicted adenine nucleotide alpha hydrolase (AANH) superfamily ATPase
VTSGTELENSNLAPQKASLFYKFYLFSSQDFEFFRTPNFLGSEYLICVALPYNACKNNSVSDFYMEAFEIDVSKRSSDSISFSPDSIAHVAANLRAKLNAEQECKALFDARNAASDWVFESKQSLRVNWENPTDELLAAKKIAENFLLLKLSERRMLAGEILWSSHTAVDHTQALSKKPLRSYYNLLHPEIAPIIQEHDRKKKLLLHVCCGPDAAGVVEQLKDEFELCCFWYDPNIQPKAEYDLRLNAFLKVADLLDVKAIVGEYDAENFLNKISGLEASPEQGAKCTLCYDMRLERSAHEARMGNFDLFSTTLAISPHKVQKKLKDLGEKLSKKYEIPYLARNFMKHDGFKDSVTFTEENDIYRQDYCGCWFSLHEGGPTARTTAQQLGLTAENLKSGSYTLPNNS